MAHTNCRKIISLNYENHIIPEQISNEEEISISIEIIYKISTCHDICRGGDHRIEALCGRVLNHASASLSLMVMGYYDEALSLCRSIGEIANLMAYFCIYPDKFPIWVQASRSQRIQQFSPTAVRKGIKRKNSFEMPMTEDDYRLLCETATHVTPYTRPNDYSTGDKKGHVGPHIQENGKEKVLEILSNLLIYIAIMGSKMTNNEDYFKTMTDYVENYNSAE